MSDYVPSPVESEPRGVKHGLDEGDGGAGGASATAASAAMAPDDERPAKLPREEPHKSSRINAVQAGPRNDEDVRPCLEEAEIDDLEWYDETLYDSQHKQIGGLRRNLHRTYVVVLKAMPSILFHSTWVHLFCIVAMATMSVKATCLKLSVMLTGAVVSSAAGQ